ncbi:hypothetical protein [Undibacterium sp. Ji49W]|uniref:hypothetical protein n=1 Tax=Undibacterium sp. Ji49W TaxID=3413040 RepID=UPI003BF0F136
MKPGSKYTIRSRLLEVCALFDSIDVALFSTFNFNGDFFEENVLPALFGMDNDDSRPVRSREVHKALTKTSVGVIYDPSVAKHSGKAYRYTHYPVFIPGSLFHAKNIFIIGKRKKTDTNSSEESWIYVATLSGNLSLSGWGENCEVMADTWIHSKNEQPWSAMDQYLGWLNQQFSIKKSAHNPLAAAIRLMNETIRERRSLVDPEGTSWKDKNHLRLYFSPLHDSFWDFAFDDVKEINTIEVASPYWGSVNECVNLLEQKASFSDDVKISLVMDYLPLSSPKKTGLGIGDKDALAKTWSGNVAFELWKHETGRFHHLKLYRFGTDKGVISAVGSCNFSRPGLFWNLGKKDGKKISGNVESMMLDMHEGIDWPTRPASDIDFSEENTSDDAPKPLPYYVVVFYDWKSGEYSWSLTGNPGAQSIRLKLSDFDIMIDEAHREGKKSGKLDKSQYTFSSGDGDEMSGFVIELNLEDSTREYITPLATDLILQSWLQGTVNEPMPGEKGDADGDGESDNDPLDENLVLKDDKEQSLFFDFYDFYRAIAGIEKKLATSSGDGEILELLLSRSDSVKALGSAMTKSAHSTSVKYLVLNECIRLMKNSKEKKLHSFIKKFQKNIDEYRLMVMHDMENELSKGTPIDVSELLSWYEKQFRSAA